jgi:hypothetical protein
MSKSENVRSLKSEVLTNNDYSSIFSDTGYQTGFIEVVSNKNISYLTFVNILFLQ